MLVYFVTACVILFVLLKLLYNKYFGDGDRMNSAYREQWFGRGPAPAQESSDETIRLFKIHVADEVLSDLESRLKNTRYEESLEEKDFEYGFHSEYLHEVVEYWKSQYQWRKQEEELNKYPHFKTRIEGIDIHFVHVKPNTQKKTKPLLMIHGWPGSFYEFYKIIPMLTSEQAGCDFVFEIICPSIPGYGFSEAPHHKGCNQLSVARILGTLMTRLGHNQFYVQGGDWGSIVATLLSKLYPSKVVGLHLNMLPVKTGPLEWCKMVLISLFPAMVPAEEYSLLFPLKEKIGMLLQETGYFHIQATKPDTVGSGLADSPIGLAAYILEKFSTWTDAENRKKSDGGLTKKYPLDSLLTNVMIYWVNNNIKSSVRFYKEYVKGEDVRAFDRKPILVPFGVAVFPNELFMLPKSLISRKLVKNLVSYNVQPRGGHFAAMEEPQLLAKDFWAFVKLVEESK